MGCLCANAAELSADERVIALERFRRLSRTFNMSFLMSEMPTSSCGWR
jgi:hypothetical protein